MHVDMARLNEYVRFLRDESRRVRERGDGGWADRKAAIFSEISEFLRQLSQEKQMNGDKRLSDNGS